MKILAIETSCDETAVAVLSCSGDIKHARFRVLGNALYSQAKVHEAYGGVYPTLAKREHAQNLTSLLQAALSEAGMLQFNPHELSPQDHEMLAHLLQRESVLAEKLSDFAQQIEIPEIDAIAVTHGPGLEPALWVGLNAARALSALWQKPLIPTNHLEGHIVSSLVLPEKEAGIYTLSEIRLPAMALIISGGHTQLVYMKEWFRYEIIGETRDDAVGEAFDKVARLLGLPYPGGPEVSKLAYRARREGINSKIKLPRPMINSDDFDFSFSGLKTAALYALKQEGELTQREIKGFAREFEEAVLDVLVAKTHKALSFYPAETLVMGGGVSASRALRASMQEMADLHHPHMDCAAADPKLATDNAVMIAMAGYMRSLKEQPVVYEPSRLDDLRAEGNLKLTQ